MSRINQSWKMGTLEIKNRLIRSATDEGFATPEGAPTQRLIDIDTELARGGVGLIIAGTAHISLEGKWGNNGIGMDHDNLIKPLKRLCKATQEAGGTLAAQLLHCGTTVNPVTLSERGALLGPSAMIDPLFGHPVEELTQDHILKIVDDYAKAASRAKEAGFDAVQIHSGHGYGHPTVKDKVNQLEKIIEKWNHGTHTHSTLQAGVFDPLQDHLKPGCRFQRFSTCTFHISNSIKR